MNKLTKRQTATLILILTLLLFLWFVWPTPYVIVKEKASVVRINRFTGVREQATDKGWMTQEQLLAEGKAKTEQKTAEDRAKSEHILSELKTLKMDDDRNDYKKVALYNPTDWELSNGIESGYDTIVEYYKKEKSGLEEFLGKVETNNFFIRPRSYNDFRLFDYRSEPPEVMSLPIGTDITQKITIRFSKATNIKSSDAGDMYVRLQPPFELKCERSWIISETPSQ